MTRWREPWGVLLIGGRICPQHTARRRDWAAVGLFQGIAPSSLAYAVTPPREPSHPGASGAAPYARSNADGEHTPARRRQRPPINRVPGRIPAARTDTAVPNPTR